MRIDGTKFTVLDTVGIEELGGDDLDLVLAWLFARRMKLELDSLPPLQRDLLLQHARRQKESIATGGVKTLRSEPTLRDLPALNGGGGSPCSGYVGSPAMLAA